MVAEGRDRGCTDCGGMLRPVAETGPRRRLALSTAIFSLATGLSRVLGLVREIFAAYFFGTSGSINAFTIAFQIPNLVRALVASSSLLFAVLWLRGGGAVVPVVAHLVWRLVAEVVFAGDVFDLEPNKLPTGARASGTLVWVSAVAMVAAALLTWRWAVRLRLRSPAEDS